MWSLETVWFELSVFSIVLLFGNILMGHFEERTSRSRRAIKTAILLVVFTSISVLLGKIVAFIVLGLSFLPVFYIHGIALGKKGINGWTGEPKEKYYELRGWDKDIFKQKDKI